MRHTLSDDLLKELRPLIVMAPVTSGAHQTELVIVEVAHHSEALAGVLAQAMTKYPNVWHRVHQLGFTSVEAARTAPLTSQASYTQGTLNARLHRAVTEGRVEKRSVTTGITRDGQLIFTTLWRRRLDTP